MRGVNEERRVVVVGSGPAGAAAAVFLANAGADVLLLEAGHEGSELGLTAKIAGVTVAKYRRRLPYRGATRMTGDPKAVVFEHLAPGGLSNHWSCAVPRFARDDFADAERAGEKYAWPIGYDELAPWYDRVEPLLHIAGPSEDAPHLPAGKIRHSRRLAAYWSGPAEIARETGRSIVAMPYAYGADTTVTFTGTPFNAFVRLIRPSLRQRKLAIRYGTRVLRLEWSPRTRRVERVVVRNRRTGSEETVRCAAVVLAAGAINTAQILLESSCADFPAGLGNAHGVLGRYFHDHPLGKLVIDLREVVEASVPAYVTRRGLEHSTALYAAAGMQWSGMRPLLESVRRGHPGKLRTIGFSVFGTMAPTEDDRVELDSASPRHEGAAALSFHSRHPPEALSVLDEARDDIVRALEGAGWQPRVRTWDIDPVGSSVHYGGTCRMHASPKFGMLDRLSRLYDVRNVAVADSAAFTTGPEKNPVLTSMALAARASDALAGEVSSGDL